MSERDAYKIKTVLKELFRIFKVFLEISMADMQNKLAYNKLQQKG